MPIRSLADITAAYDEGRCHSQMFFKTSISTYDRWVCPEFAAGLPGYQPRIGPANTFEPCSMSNSSSVWFPSISEGEERVLHTLTLRSSQATYTGPMSFVVYDLLGFYPLIDASVGDYQPMINDVGLPRYADGAGVQMMIVQYIAGTPSAVFQDVLIDYEDDAGQRRIVSTPTLAGGVLGSVASRGEKVQTAYASPFVQLDQASNGVRKVNGVSISGEVGVFYCIYLVRPIATSTTVDNQVCAEKDFALHNGFCCPRILDGACLNLTYMMFGAQAYQTSLYGNFNFVWG